ncbi:protein aurora borealis-like [Rhagoletis pomonella]|uniref:protein aurora borealis-like n=1 Tax=Rhagoletis pomonella TaxID=28610 RepID=UPI00177C3DAA|nr:protein aurora borealis-like [Rhagoletis pomonella]
MEFEKARTSLKLYSTMQMSGMLAHKVNNENVELITAPGGSRCQKKILHPRTPSKTINCSISTTINSMSSSSSKQMSCSTALSTPPAKRFHRIRNPFEPVLAERLHLPLIASPSLFQRPTTPQLSSTQFEWNIDEVSSLKPANVEPHETQFHDSPDPEYEAKAQSAISSYFKEHQIVPSPVECPLRSHRIILSELNSYTPISKSGRRIRDCGTQTELSLPVVLPRALEEALMPYFQPHLAVADRHNCETDSQMRFSTDSHASIFNDVKDVSLRRNLFDMKNIVVLEEGRTPTIEAKCKMTHSNSSPSSNCGSSCGGQFVIVGKLSDSLDKSSFGSLSPISASDGLSNSPHSPYKNRSEMKPRIHTFLQDLSDVEQLSPIHPQVRQTSKRCLVKPQETSKSQYSSKDSYRCNALNQSEATTLGDISLAYINGRNNESENFTPDGSSSPLRLNPCSAETVAAIGQQSIDSSFNIKVSRLAVNSSKSTKQSLSHDTRPTEYDVFPHDDTNDLIDDDEMQVSQLSAQNFNCSSSSSTDTPRSKRRSASRKNLSQSFSLNWLDDDELEEDVKQQDEKLNLQKSPLDVPRIDITVMDELIVKEHEQQQKHQKQLQKDAVYMDEKYVIDDNRQDTAVEEPRALFYRVDSGFNEMPASGCSSTYSIGASQQCDSALSPTDQLEVSMVCCSTPSKHIDTSASC